MIRRRLGRQARMQRLAEAAQLRAAMQPESSPLWAQRCTAERWPVVQTKPPNNPTPMPLITDRLINEVRDYAERHYDRGWDTIVECWSDDEIASAIAGARTLAGAIRKLRPIVGVYRDRQADAERHRREALGDSY